MWQYDTYSSPFDPNPNVTDHREAVEGYVKYIWDKFLCDSSPTQICMSGAVLLNTVKRLKLLHIYGREVFSETLIDPMKTMRKDILPRFLNSDIYQELLKQLVSCERLPTAAMLGKMDNPPPTHTNNIQEQIIIADRNE